MSSAGVGGGDETRRRYGGAANTFSEKPHNLVAILSRDTNQICFSVPSLEGLGIIRIGPHF